MRALAVWVLACAVALAILATVGRPITQAIDNATAALVSPQQENHP
jgi:hypothetical protein